MLGNVHLTPQLVQAVRDAADIVDIAGEHTQLRRAGRRQSGLCPLHKEKTPSFSVDPVQGLFYCFGCGQGGDAIKLHMLLSGDDFPAAIESLARRYRIPLPTRPAGRRGEPRERDLGPALEAAAKHFRAQLAASPEPRGYLEKRGFEEEIVDRFELGYAADAWQGLHDALHPRFPLDDLLAAGLVARSEKPGGRVYDRFRHRLMFPIRAPSGRLVGFGGRTLGDDVAKYVNTSETSQFRKGHLLYALNGAKRAIREAGRACLVEGYFDVLGAVASGVEWTVATMGTALTPEQARLLARHADEVVVGYDGDRAGEEAFRRALPLLLAEGLAVRRAHFGEGHDPDSLRQAEGPEAVRSAIEEAPDAVVLEIDRQTPSVVHRDAQARSRAARAIAELLRAVRDEVLRYTYSRRAADRLGVPLELLWKRPAAQRSAAAPRREESSESRLVRTIEEKVLQLLLADGAVPPPLAELPPPEAFLVPECRNIFLAFRDLYEDDPEKAPDVKGVLARLADDGAEVDHLARLLLEGAFDFRAEELSEGLARLTRRWRRQRLRELSSEMSRAESAGDRERFERLLSEKTELALSLHRGPSQGAAGDG